MPFLLSNLKNLLSSCAIKTKLQVLRQKPHKKLVAQNFSHAVQINYRITQNIFAYSEIVFVNVRD